MFDNAPLLKPEEKSYWQQRVAALELELEDLRATCRRAHHHHHYQPEKPQADVLVLGSDNLSAIRFEWDIVKQSLQKASNQLHKEQDALVQGLYSKITEVLQNTVEKAFVESEQEQQQTITDGLDLPALGRNIKSCPAFFSSSACPQISQVESSGSSSAKRKPHWFFFSWTTRGTPAQQDSTEGPTIPGGVDRQSERCSRADFGWVNQLIANHQLPDDHWLVGICRFIDCWYQLKEPEREGCLANVIKSKIFEGTVLTVIMVNSIVTVYSTNYMIQNLTNETTSWMTKSDIAFASFYSFELLLKIIVHRFFFFL